MDAKSPENQQLSLHLRQSEDQTGSNAHDGLMQMQVLDIQPYPTRADLTIRSVLRKLHLRWWHATEPKVQTILQAAGIDGARLELIKLIVDTCREGRAWQKQGNEIISSI